MIAIRNRCRRSNAVALATLSLCPIVPMASASDYDVESLLYPSPWEPGSSASVERTREWSARRDGADAFDASLENIGSRASLDWSLTADHSELKFGPAAPGSRYAEDEGEGTVRWNSSSGTQIVADASVQVAEGDDAKFLDRLDVSAVIAFHPDAHATHSLVYLLWATTQPSYPLPRVAPGIAYCFASRDLTLAVGVPFSAIEWRAASDVSLSASVADSARMALAWRHPRWDARLIAALTTASYRVIAPGRGPVRTWEDGGIGAQLGFRPADGIDFDLRAGRQLTRRLFDESGHVLWDAGPAWSSTAIAEISW